LELLKFVVVYNLICLIGHCNKWLGRLNGTIKETINKEKNIHEECN
jgi:hypothetical protein